MPTVLYIVYNNLSTFFATSSLASSASRCVRAASITSTGAVRLLGTTMPGSGHIKGEPGDGPRLVYRDHESARCPDLRLRRGLLRGDFISTITL